MDGPSIRLHVRVSPSSTRPEVVGRRGSSWKLRVAPAPERGKANEAVLDLLAETLQVPRSQVELLKGERARDKVVALRGLTKSQAESRLEAATERKR